MSQSLKITFFTYGHFYRRTCLPAIVHIHMQHVRPFRRLRKVKPRAVEDIFSTIIGDVQCTLIHLKLYPFGS